MQELYLDSSHMHQQETKEAGHGISYIDHQYLHIHKSRAESRPTSDFRTTTWLFVHLARNTSTGTQKNVELAVTDFNTRRRTLSGTGTVEKPQRSHLPLFATHLNMAPRIGTAP